MHALGDLGGQVLRRPVGRGGLPGVPMLFSLLFLLLSLTHPVEVCPQFSLGGSARCFALGVLHFFKIVIFLFFVVVSFGLVLDGEETGLILFFYFFGDDLEVIFEEIHFFVTLDQSLEEMALFDVGSRHFVDDFDCEEVVPFSLNHSLLFLHHVQVVLCEGVKASGF